MKIILADMDVNKKYEFSCIEEFIEFLTPFAENNVLKLIIDWEVKK